MHVNSQHDLAVPDVQAKLCQITMKRKEGKLHAAGKILKRIAISLFNE